MKMFKLLAHQLHKSLLTFFCTITASVFLVLTPYIVDAQDKISTKENNSPSKKTSSNTPETRLSKDLQKDELMNKDSAENYEMVAPTEPFTDKFGPVTQANLGPSLLTNEVCQLVAQKDVEQTDQLQLSDIVCNGTLIAN